LFLISPDFKTERKLTPRTFSASSAGFSKDGRPVIGVFRNTSGQGAEWQLLSIDVASGTERKLADLDLPVTTDDLRGFSLHPTANGLRLPSPNGPSIFGCSKASTKMKNKVYEYRPLRECRNHRRAKACRARA
jgi:hypothetical protein